MNKQIFIYKTLALVSITLATWACDTDVKSLTIHEPRIEHQNENLYKAYLEELKAYKAGKHQVSLAYLDNSRSVTHTQAHRISAVPDSLDYLILTSPTSISEQDAEEIQINRSKKGIKTLYTIDFENIKLVHDLRVQEFEANEANAGKTYTPSLNDFLVDSVAKSLAWCNQYGYDGIVMSYEGKNKLYMSSDERQTYTSYEQIFIGMTLDWSMRNPQKELLLQGHPQYIFSQDVFDRAKYIILDLRRATAKRQAAMLVAQASTEQVPRDKFVALVSTFSLDKADDKIGYWETKSAILEAARWSTEYNPQYSLAGLAVYNLANDYYQPSFTFGTIREAISIINPSIKK